MTKEEALYKTIFEMEDSRDKLIEENAKLKDMLQKRELEILKLKALLYDLQNTQK